MLAVSDTDPNENINDADGIVAWNVAPSIVAELPTPTEDVVNDTNEIPANEEPLDNEPDGIKNDDALTNAAVSTFLV